jgi:mannose-6-phosphate isomerase-like protein (cupin superfamily)
MHRRALQGTLLAGLLASCEPHAAGDRASSGDTLNFGRPTVFSRGEGEQRLMRGSRPLFIVADSATVGSRTLVAGYEDVPPGDSGRTHRHLAEDELIFVHRGTLDIVLGDTTYRVGAGASVFIPRHTWVTFRTVGSDTAGFWFVFNVPGFEKCLRALSAQPWERFVAPSQDAFDQVSRECHWQLKGR